MARIRSIHPDACKSRRLASLSAEAERCYWRLQTHCDDEGRCEDDALLICRSIFQASADIGPTDVEAWLFEMAAAGSIDRYEVEGVLVIQILEWDRYQHPRKPKPSSLPPPFGNGRAPVRDSDATGAVPLSLGEGEGEGGEREAPAPTKEHPIPDGWQPSEATKAWVRENYPQHATKAVLAAFIDHATAKRRKLVNWDSGFRNWVRLEEKFHPAPEKRGPSRTHL